jgi:hypothetical protein
MFVVQAWSCAPSLKRLHFCKPPMLQAEHISYCDTTIPRLSTAGLNAIVSDAGLMTNRCLCLVSNAPSHEARVVHV